MHTDIPTTPTDDMDATTQALDLPTSDIEVTSEQPQEALSIASEQNTSTDTTPLPELTPQSVPVLAEGSVLGDRYQVVSVLGPGSIPNTHIYDVVDLQGHLRCWACGSGNSEPGDMYCVECGAQLTGRHYRLQELPLDVDQPVATPVPQAILENRVPGVGHVYDTYTSKVGPMYVVWEEAYGRTLDSWLPGLTIADPSSPQASAPEKVEEGQATTWIAQAANMLAHLHAEGIVGCAIKPDNLLVQPGDRLLLLDPSGCREMQESPVERTAAQAEDIRNLGAELERWYLAVRSYDGVAQSAPAITATDEALTSEDSPMIAGADESTGPLETVQNLALVLTRAREGVYSRAEELANALSAMQEVDGPQPFLQLWSGRASDVGQVRPLNEDSVLTLEATVLEQDGHLPVGLYVIADGMGGHENGEVASSIAVRTIGAIVNSALIGPLVAGETVARDVTSCGGLLRQAVIEANRRIANLAQDRHSDLGTTVVAAIVIGGQVSVANVGDSRAYIWHAGQATPLTHDHSLVAQLVAAGQIEADDIYTHPRRNEIYRALGDARLTESEVDLFSHHLQPGDGLLLCSDGLWDFVRDPAITDIMAEHQNTDPQSTCNALVEQANIGGGEDNISVVFVRVMRDVMSET